MAPRIEAETPPCAAEIEATLKHVMPPGLAPLVLLTTLARNPSKQDSRKGE
jgi:hypothetical protein